jgi:hypothetical protein
MISIKVDDIKIAHAIVIVLRCLDYLRPPRDQFSVDSVDIAHKHTDPSVAG